MLDACGLRVPVVANMLLAAVSEAALFIATSDDPAAALDAGLALFDTLLDTLLDRLFGAAGPGRT